MNRKIILFGAFLSAFILLLVPSIGSINVNIQNENNLNIKNITIEDIKKITKRILNSDCNCQKTVDNNNIKDVDFDVLCSILFAIILSIVLLFNVLEKINLKIVRALEQILELIIYPFLSLIEVYGEFYECDWMGE